jgi:hypothetical protein
MTDDHSKQRKQAEAEFAKTQDPAGSKTPNEPTLSAADENTARLKASRLARDAADSKAKDKGPR